MISLPLLVTFKFPFTVYLAFLTATLCLWLHRSADLWILCVHLTAIRISGTTCSQPFLPLVHHYDVGNRNLKARCSSCHLCAALGTNYLMGKSYTHYPGDEGQGILPRSRSRATYSPWVADGVASPLLELVPTQPSPHPWAESSKESPPCSRDHLRPSNLLFTPILELCRATLLPQPELQAGLQCLPLSRRQYLPFLLGMHLLHLLALIAHQAPDWTVLNKIALSTCMQVYFLHPATEKNAAKRLKRKQD